MRATYPEAERAADEFSAHLEAAKRALTPADYRRLLLRVYWLFYKEKQRLQREGGPS